MLEAAYTFFKTCVLDKRGCVMVCVPILRSCWDSHWYKTWGKGREIIKNDEVKEQRNERREEAAGKGAGRKERQRQLTEGCKRGRAESCC